MHPLSRLVLISPFILTCASLAAPPSKVLVVVEENHSFQQIIGSPAAPYMNSLAQNGALFTNMYALTHPSQPNYLHLFAGDNQSVTTDTIPTAVPYSTPNLAAALFAAGRGFVAYSQSLPSVGSLVNSSGYYQRKHAPWTNWQSPAPSNVSQFLPDVHQPFTNFPTDFSLLPTVTFVVPDQLNDMHDGTIAQADDWLRTNIDPFVQWAMANDALLIVTWDEDETASRNLIPTIFYGPMVRTGTVDSTWTHHNLLRTLCSWYGALTPSVAANTRPIVGAFTSDLTTPATQTLSFRQGEYGYAGCVDTYIEQAAPDASHPTALNLVADGSPLSQVLIRFDNFLGTGPGQVPPGSQILSAKLILLTGSVANDQSTNFMRLHTMLIPWTDAATWNSLVGGVSQNGIESVTLPEFARIPAVLNAYAIFDVSNSVQSIADGTAANLGWVINPTGTDGWRPLSSETPVVTDRPRLEVTFIPPPPVPPHCPADFNNSGTVTVQDIFDFLAAWFAHDINADFNQSGTVTVQDIFDFLSAWFTKCP